MKRTSHNSFSWNDLKLEEFVSAFPERYHCSAVSRIVYCPTTERLVQVLREQLPSSGLEEHHLTLFWNLKITEKAAASSLRCSDDQIGLGIPTAICVYPSAANYAAEELVSIIRDHEYIHAQDWFEGIPINYEQRITQQNISRFLPDTVKAMAEVRAYKHQLDAMPEAWARREISRTAFDNYCGYKRVLENILKFPENQYELEIVREFLRSRRELRM